jgi:hypothetical protein
MAKEQPQVDGEDVTAEEPQELTVREEIEKARDEIAARPEPTPAEDKAAGAPKARERGTDGRFGRKQAEGGASTPAAPPPGGQAAPPASAAPQQAAPPPVSVAPQGWPQQAKADWAKLPPHIQAAVTQREADIHKLATSMDQERQIGREFAQVANNYQDVLQQSGVHPLRYFDDVMRIMRLLSQGSMQQKIALLQGVAQRQGIDFRALLPQGAQPGAGPAGAAPPQPPPIQYPPELLEMARWMGSFRQQQEEMQRRQAQEAAEAQAAMAQQVMTEIEAFRAQPTSEFFDHVRDYMTVLLANGQADDLQSAYDQAIHSRPDIRQLLATREKEAAAREAAKRANVLRARARGGSIRGGTGGNRASTPSSKGSVREDLEAAIAEVGGRV